MAEIDMKEKLVELIGNVQDSGVVIIPAGFGETYSFVKNELVADCLIANGVTVQEWKPISEPPKEKGTYLVCTDNGGVLLGHWYGTAWNAGGGAKKRLACWMEKPQPPKGE